MDAPRIACFALICLGIACRAMAAEETQITVFRGAEIGALPTDQQHWPETLRGADAEGWANVSMMIDPQGKPYEVAIYESSGSEPFNTAAVALVNKMSYRPATLSGVPVDSEFKFKVVFTRYGKASRKFLKTFESLTQAVKDRDQALAGELLGKLQVTNLSEEAYLNLARYYYHRTWGTPRESLADLRQAIAGEKQPKLLPKTMFVGALTEQFRLQVKNGDFGGALYTWRTMQPHAEGNMPQDMLEKVKEAVGKIEAARANDEKWYLPGRSARARRGSGGCSAIGLQSPWAPVAWRRSSSAASNASCSSSSTRRPATRCRLNMGTAVSRCWAIRGRSST